MYSDGYKPNKEMRENREMEHCFLRFPGFKLKALTLSYDDGAIFDKKLIELMSKYALKGTFNINSGLFALDEGGRCLTQKEAFDLYTQSDNEVAVHGVKHLPLTALNSAQALGEILLDRQNLEGIFHKLVHGMAYAYGIYNDAVVERARLCGINYARTVDDSEGFALPTDWLRWKPTCHHRNPKLMDLAQAFLEEQKGGYWRKSPQLFYLWGHSYEFDNNDNWAVIEEFAEYVGNREEIWYATNGEIFEYLQACNRLEWSMDATFVRNPSVIDVYINYLGKEICVRSGETIQLK